MVKVLDSIGEPNQFFNKIVGGVINKGVSDIHITPMKGKTLIRYRLAGELLNYCIINEDSYKRLVNVIKINAKMDTNELIHPQDGKIFMEFNLKDRTVGVNLRISTLPTIHGDNIVIRILVKDDRMVDIEKLGFSKKNLEMLHDVVNLRNGLVLFSGGTGSGKTTTLYAMLKNFDPFKKTIFTLEDPVEFQVDGYIQSEVKSDYNENRQPYTFAEGLKGLLRQDPDIILVGEIRSQDEASMCLEAANTGHLVMGSVHANDAISVINRLRQLGIKSYMLSSGLKYVVYQKLMRKLCTCHKKENIIATDQGQYIRERYGFEKVEVGIVNHEGCEKCLNGYAGLTLVSEIIQIDDVVGQMIFDERSLIDIKNYIYEKGFLSVHEDALFKSLDGLVDFNEAMSLRF